jgi:hypothetical protein
MHHACVVMYKRVDGSVLFSAPALAPSSDAGVLLLLLLPLRCASNDCFLSFQNKTPNRQNIICWENRKGWLKLAAEDRSSTKVSNAFDSDVVDISVFDILVSAVATTELNAAECASV